MIVGREIVHLPTIGSTMDLLDELARAGADEGLVVLADEQTAGRGRWDRGWSGPPGGLYCSVLLRPPVRPARLGALSLLLGLAVAEAAEAVAPVRCSLKWPNDVLIAGLKVAGVLVRSRLAAVGVDFVNVGIGLNVAQPLELLPVGATTLRAASGRNDLRRDDLLPGLWSALDRRYRMFIDADGLPSLDSWRARASMLGEEVSVVQDRTELGGRFIGIGDDGSLLLERADGDVVTVVQGDLTRGPRRGDA